MGFSGNGSCWRRSRRSNKEITSDRTPFTAIPCYEGFLLRRSSGSSCHFSRLELPIELVTESRRPKASCRINEEGFCRSPVPQKSEHRRHAVRSRDEISTSLDSIPSQFSANSADATRAISPPLPERSGIDSSTKGGGVGRIVEGRIFSSRARGEELGNEKIWNLRAFLGKGK